MGHVVRAMQLWVVAFLVLLSCPDRLVAHPDVGMQKVVGLVGLELTSSWIESSRPPLSAGVLPLDHRPLLPMLGLCSALVI